jgi:hypothetical protein
VQPNLSARFPLEVLDGIGDVHIGPINPRGVEAFVKQLTGRSDKWLPLLVFAIAGLLPYQENSGMGAAFAKDNLGGFPIEVASLAVFRGFL